jgi:hypothetical protein
MTNHQLELSAFSGKTISMDESTKDFRPWNRTILDWEIEYRGYNRGEDGPEGYIDFHVVVEINEAVIIARNPKTYKKVEKPGYKLSIFQNMAFEGKEWESYVVHEESFEKKKLKKAFDAFQRELMNIQCWVEIGESRARIIPQANDVFECFHCGWVTDIWADDIMCQGCGKRYWSERLWNRGTGSGCEVIPESSSQ